MQWPCVCGLTARPVSVRHIFNVSWHRVRASRRALVPLQGYILVYSITDDTTFAKLDRVREEIMRAQGGRPVPIFLVGTKKDLAGDRAVSDKERVAKSRQWNCQSYEVSAKTNDGIDEVFERMIQQVLALASDPTKGGGGGSVLGAGKLPAPEEARTFKKKTCSML